MALAARTKLGLHYAGEARPKKEWATLREAAVLTGSYVATDHMLVEDVSDVCLLFEYTQGSLTSFEYIVEHSMDATVWIKEGQIEPAEPIVDTAPNHTFADDDNYELVFPVPAKFVRARVKGTGTVTGSSLAITAVGVN